jgi:hypothetical protein
MKRSNDRWIEVTLIEKKKEQPKHCENFIFPPFIRLLHPSLRKIGIDRHDYIQERWKHTGIKAWWKKIVEQKYETAQQ